MFQKRVELAVSADEAPAVDHPVSPWLLVLMAAHVPLAVLLVQVSVLAAVHAAVVVGIGVIAAVRGRSVALVGYFAAYITGAEVFWRMTNDRLPWELGKYSLILLCTIGVLRLKGLRGLIWPLLGISLYLPSTVLTFMDLAPDEARNQIAFNLSGPLTLVLVAQFFSTIKLTPGEVRRLLIVLIVPVVGIATVVLHGIAITPDIVWTTESNYATSGGFGPNQVSAALGLGALAAFLCVCDVRTGVLLRLSAAAAMLWFAVQSVLTFSRGGMYCAVGAAAAASLFLVRSKQTRLKVCLAGVVIYAVGATLIWPRLDQFTGGAITARYQEVDTTGRADIGAEDLAIWSANPIFGVGPGRSRFFHSHGAATHTEFTRLVSEHGSFGFVVLILLALAVLRNLRRAESAREQALVIAFMSWSLMFMVTAAMRMVAPSFVFGLAFATFIPCARVADSKTRPATRMRPSINEPAFI